MPRRARKPKEEYNRMQTQVRYLGVDVSKDMLVVAFERNRWQFPNSKEGYAKLIGQLQKQAGTVHVVCEATGPYHLPICLALQEAGFPLSIANPAWIKYFGRSEGVLAKTDPIDAALIERYANASARRRYADSPRADRPHRVGQSSGSARRLWIDASRQPSAA